MCIAVYAAKTADQVEVSFALERIYQKRAGGSHVWIDLLIKNVGTSSIDQFRIIIPFKMSSLKALRKKQLEKASHIAEDLRKRQAKKVVLRTDELRIATHPSNWLYAVLQHVNVERGVPDGVFRVRRDSHTKGRLDGRHRRN